MVMVVIVMGVMVFRVVMIKEGLMVFRRGSWLTIRVMVFMRRLKVKHMGLGMLRR